MSMEEQWNRDWAAGSIKSGEVLVRLAIERNDPLRLQSLIADLIKHPQAKPKDLAAFGRLLMENQKFAEAVSVFSRLDEFGIPNHSQALSYAEALWKTGRRAEALDIAGAFNQTAKVDPALRLSLAAFYLSVDRPDAAIFQMDQPGQSFLSTQKAAPLRAAAGAILLGRDRLNDAKVQITIAAQVPNATPPDLVADFYDRSGKAADAGTGDNDDGPSEAGNLFELSPAANEFALKENDLRAFRWVVAQRSFAHGFPDTGLAWLMIDPELAASREARTLVADSTDASPESLKTYWSLVSESPWLEARLAAKTFFEEAGPNQTKPRP
jgi:hypothetical protein